MTLIQGKDLILFFRALKNQDTDDGARLAYQVEYTYTKDKENEATSTKDGIINTTNDGEKTIESTSLADRNNTGTIAVWEELEGYFDDDEIVEVWQVDTKSLQDGEVKAVYTQGLFTSYELSAPSDGNAEVSFSYSINGKPQKGSDTLTEAQLGALSAAQYEYQSIQAGGATEGA